VKQYLYAAAAVVALAAPAYAAPKLPALAGSPVVDAAKVLTAPQRAELAAQLTAVNAVAGHQMAVAIVPDLQGYSPAQLAAG
jgi:uncharacterized membrane protein YgcG